MEVQGGRRKTRKTEWFTMEVYWFRGVASLMVCVRVKRARPSQALWTLVLWFDAMGGRENAEGC